MTNSQAFRRTFRWLTAACVLLAPAFTGCQSLALPTKLPWSKETVKESEFQTPVRIVALWAEDIMTQQGQTPARGFGARLYFYNERNQAIPVEGQLVVYGYDDSSSDVSSRSPDRKFVFTAEQFAQHYSKSDFGASYSVWVPWDAVGGVEKEISLIPVFTSSAGKVVVGPQGVNLLSGTKKSGEVNGQVGRTDRRTQPSPNVRSVSHWEIAAQKANTRENGQAGNEFARDAEVTGHHGESPDERRRASSMRSSTIFVPDSLGRRMAAEPAEPMPTQDTSTTGSQIRQPIRSQASASVGQPMVAPQANSWPNGGGLPPAPAPQAMDPRFNDPRAGTNGVGQPVPNVGPSNVPMSNDPRFSNRGFSEFPAPIGLPPTNPIPGQPSTRFQPSQFQAPTGPSAQSSRGPDPLAPSPSAWQSQPGPPSGLQSPYSRPAAW